MVFLQSYQSWIRAKKNVYNGSVFDSQFEADYARELDLRVKAKDILKYERQVKIPLVVNGYLITNYYIDFILYHPGGTVEYVECKGYATKSWRLKWKLFEALYSGKEGVKLTVIKQRENFKLRKLKKLN